MHVHLSRCQSAARNITKEVETISDIDCRNQSAAASVATIEAKRTIINAALDEMIRVIKVKDEVAPPPSFQRRRSMNEFFQEIIAKHNTTPQPMLEMNFPGCIVCEDEAIKVTQNQYDNIDELVKLVRNVCGNNLPVYIRRFYYLHGKKNYQDKTSYFLGGTVRTAAQVKADNLPEESTLRRNISSIGYKTVIRTPYGNIMPFDPDHDKVIEVTT